MGGLQNPHDRLFRKIVSKPTVGGPLCRSMVPKDFAARVDWDHLELQPTDFIALDLGEEQHGDVLYRTHIDGRDAYIYLQLEHQSTPDRWMAWRMLRYMTAIWTKFREENPGAGQLPVVVPLVVYTGHRGQLWSYPTDLSALIEADEAAQAELGNCIPQFHFLLKNLVGVELATLWACDLPDRTVVTLFLLSRTYHNPHLVAELQPGVPRLRRMMSSPNGLDDLYTMLFYIYDLIDTDIIELDPFLNQLGPEAQEVYMTLTERLRAEGEAKGRVEGEAKGRVEGEAKGEAKLLIRMLKQRFGSLSEAILETVRQANSEQVETWSDKIFVAATIDDVFAQ